MFSEKLYPGMRGRRAEQTAEQTPESIVGELLDALFCVRGATLLQPHSLFSKFTHSTKEKHVGIIGL